MASDPPTFAVPSGFLGIGRREHDAAISIAGVPLDIGTTNRSGARFGPQAIRHASRMLVDGAHPTEWINVSKLMLSDIGDFRIALGDIPASLKAIEEQAAAVDHLAAIDANDIQPIIDSTFPLDQIEAAFRHQLGHARSLAGERHLRRQWYRRSGPSCVSQSFPNNVVRGKIRAIVARYP